MRPLCPWEATASPESDDLGVSCWVKGFLEPVDAKTRQGLAVPHDDPDEGEAASRVAWGGLACSVTTA